MSERFQISVMQSIDRDDQWDALCLDIDNVSHFFSIAQARGLSNELAKAADEAELKLAE